MINRQRVVVVDGVPETGEVLKAVLEPRGWQVNRVRRLDQLRVDQQCERPTMMILDVDCDPAASLPQDDLQDVPRVLIGTLHARTTDKVDGPRDGHFLAKPFDYAELVRAIDELLTTPKAA